MADVARRWLTPELRSTVYYFTFFTTAGATTVYGGIWFQEKGLDAGQIGIVNALPVFIMLVLTLVVGRLADRASDWRQVIVTGALMAGLIPIGLFFAHDFWSILLVWTLGAIPLAAIGPVADAAALRMTRRNGTDYGAIRAWGTVGYMVAIYLTGQIVALLAAACSCRSSWASLCCAGWYHWACRTSVRRGTKQRRRTKARAASAK